MKGIFLSLQECLTRDTSRKWLAMPPYKGFAEFILECQDKDYKRWQNDSRNQPRCETEVFSFACLI